MEYLGFYFVWTCSIVVIAISLTVIAFKMDNK